MTSSGRLSLRSRLLVLLIAVTAAFLLVMGAVSTLVLSKPAGHAVQRGTAGRRAAQAAADRQQPG